MSKVEGKGPIDTPTPLQEFVQLFFPRLLGFKRYDGFSFACFSEIVIFMSMINL